MVLVDCDCGFTHRFYPVQGKVYEMVEQAPAGAEEGSAWKVGG